MSFSGLGIGLSLVFGCLLLALVAELYYLLWWKKRIANTEIESDHSNYAKKILHLVCWKRNSSVHTGNTQETVRRDPDSNVLEQDLELGSNKLKTLGEEGVESELMRLHNLAGPPRFLFTIKEETKEDLESVDGKSRKGSRTRSLSDLIVAIDTPFLTPLPSSPLKSPLNTVDSYKHHGFNPLFESLGELEYFNSFKSSPPPKFKFLRDAEEKLYRRLVEEAHRKVEKNSVSVQESGVEDLPNSNMEMEEKYGSFIRLIVEKNQDKDLHHHQPQYPSSSSQVLPLVSSRTTLIRPLDKAPIVH
ncbi:Transmembrane protein [Quillaja saponaria]|uniref:Transmembrane protein n=1 Tax=Quillaja saponaria TaxID=32244 RepID=A0AAD7VLZ8_QUISA|nr:Transmembrane protein [Quillaja saponaria]KAJ7980872.1 Transmembrane protein [Quillaja saponaria]